jgi:excisionase family DNA binding protein
VDEPESFVDANVAARFIGVSRRRILQMARAKEIPAYAIGTGPRKTWRFKLSRLSEAFVGNESGLDLGRQPSTIPSGSSRSRKEKSPGC